MEGAVRTRSSPEHCSAYWPPASAILKNDMPLRSPQQSASPIRGTAQPWKSGEFFLHYGVCGLKPGSRKQLTTPSYRAEREKRDSLPDRQFYTAQRNEALLSPRAKLIMLLKIMNTTQSRNHAKGGMTKSPGLNSPINDRRKTTNIHSSLQPGGEMHPPGGWDKSRRDGSA